jgi:hypothetical protein
MPMRIRRLGGAAMALALSLFGGTANATAWLVNCKASPPTLTDVSTSTGPIAFGSDPGGLTGTGAAAGAPDALGALLGTGDQFPETLTSQGFTANLAGGDLVEISGICNQEVTIRKISPLTIEGTSSGTGTTTEPSPPSSPPLDGDSNEVVVDGTVSVTFFSLLFGSTTAGVALNPAPTGIPFADLALFNVEGASSATLINSEVTGSPTRGMFAGGASSLTLLSSIVTGNGVDNTNPTDNGGIQVSGSSALDLGSSEATLGSSTGNDPSIVSDNAGDGIRLLLTSSLTLWGGTVSGNGNAQLYIGGGSAALLDGNDASLVTVTAPSTNTSNAIDVRGGSNVLVEYGVTVTGGTGGAAETIVANGSSTMALQGSFISGGVVTLEATGGSLITLDGGNFICNGTLTFGAATPSCTAETGPDDIAIEIDHVGALNDVGADAEAGFSAAADTITGAGVLQLQSTADLGAGQISGQPSLVWTTGSNGISVAQNSSLRLEGGVDITGAIDLAQGSNGFVNRTKTPGVTNPNTVSAGILCPFVSVPDSHLQLGNNSLAASTPATVVATSFAGATSPQCLPF